MGTLTNIQLRDTGGVRLPARWELGVRARDGPGTTAGERSLETTALVERARFELWWGRTWRCLPEPLKVSTTPRQLEQLGIASIWFEDHMPTGKSPIIEEAGHKPIP